MDKIVLSKKLLTPGMIRAIILLAKQVQPKNRKLVIHEENEKEVVLVRE